MTVNPMTGHMMCRRTEVYADEEHKILIITGASLNLIPFNKIDDKEQLEQLRNKAKSYNEDGACIFLTIEESAKRLKFYDGITGTTSVVTFAELDDDVQQDLKTRERQNIQNLVSKLAL